MSASQCPPVTNSQPSRIVTPDPAGSPCERTSPQFGRLGQDARFVVAQDLVCGARAFGRAAFHESLEVLRAVLAREVALATRRVRLSRLLVAAELCVLADLPV